MELQYLNSIEMQQPILPADLDAVVAPALRRARQALRSMPIDAIIGVFAGLRRRLANPRSPLYRMYHNLGLGFLLEFIDDENIRRSLALALRDRAVLDGLVELAPDRFVRAEPRGVAGHWLAGNVPLLGLISVFQTLLTKNVSVVKLSSKVEDYLTPILNELQAVPGGRVLSDAVVLLKFAGSDAQANAAMARLCNIKIAWGGQEAIGAIAALPRDPEVVDVYFGPRFSLSVLDPELATDDTYAGLASDMFLFGQRACSSPHAIYIKGTEADRQAVSERLAAALGRLEGGKFFEPVDTGEASRVLNFRADRLMHGERLQMSGGTQWTLRLAAQLDRPVAWGSRIVHLYQVTEWEEFLKMLPPRLQTISHALGREDLLALVEASAPYGVHRFPRIGVAHNFRIPWDGSMVMDQLVRWVDVHL